ncbi:hypothetical protein [Sphingomonas faeni]|uniref:hypothetical protein n=1 Tax=Sphingomonas faeni TaxID=185950 RepID=UPI003EC0C236
MGDACRAFPPDRRKYPKLGKANNLVHLGTLGTGNHFIEICLDTEQGGCFTRARAALATRSARSSSSWRIRTCAVVP